MSSKPKKGARKSKKMYSKKGDRSLVKVVQNIIQNTAEKKKNDFLRSGTIDTLGSVFSCINLISTGTLPDSRRIGNKIDIFSLQLRGRVGLSDVTNKLRFIVFQWFKDFNATPVTPGDILDPLMLSTGLGVYAPYNLDQAGTYKILKDKVFVVDNQGPQTRYYKMHFKAKHFRRTELTISNTSNRPIEGEVFCLLVSDSGVAPHTPFDFISRLYYTDV